MDKTIVLTTNILCQNYSINDVYLMSNNSINDVYLMSKL